MFNKKPVLKNTILVTECNICGKELHLPFSGFNFKEETCDKCLSELEADQKELDLESMTEDEKDALLIILNDYIWKRAKERGEEKELLSMVFNLFPKD